MSRVPIGDPTLQFEKLNQTVKNFQPRWMVVDEVSSPGMPARLRTPGLGVREQS